MAHISKIIKQEFNKKEYKKLEIYNERMIAVLEFIVNNDKYSIKSASEFLQSINYPNQYNLYKIKKGLQGFRLEHFEKAKQVHNIDMNYFFDIEHTEMFLRDSKNVSTYHRLLEVVHMIGLEINK